MNPTQLLAHFDRISEAPDAIPRLRRFILDLAVRGKLVDQDPNDEPASELLKRIQDEIRIRKASGEWREPAKAIEIPLESLPFSVPPSWRWARLVECADVSYGFAFESSRFNQSNVGMPLIRIRDISRTDTEAYYEGDFDPAYIVRNADYLVGMDGDFNVRKWGGPDALLNQRVMRIRGWRAGVVAAFLAIPLQMILDHLHASTSQTTVKHLSAKQTNGIYLPLPPLAEQQRIIAKVNELMALCDRLEAAQSEREQRRDRLAAASLRRLNEPDDAGDGSAFRDHARFHLVHLPRLTARPDQIPALRQTILDLAIRGRLVPQDPDDEPASELLERIARTKRQLIASKTLRKQKDFGPLAEDAIAVDIPAQWIGTRLGTIYDVRDGTHDTPKYVEIGYPLVTSKNLSSGRLLFDDVKFISEQDHRQISERSAVEPGDILLAMIGSIGNPVIVDTDRAFSIKNVALFKYYDRSLSSPGFLCLFLQHAAGEMQKLAAGGLQPFVSLGFLRHYPMVLPPLAEQHRIVAKVDELMALCDRLEAKLTTAQTESRRLLEAVLHEALTPAA